MKKVNIIGAGLAGLSAAINLAEAGTFCRLISLQSSERAQSVMAEGGINAALNTMGENDAPSYHCDDTLKAGVFMANTDAVKNLTSAAPDIVRWLANLGVPFNFNGKDIALRPFGGQKKRRTAYSKSSTGKMLMTALIDESRKREKEGLIERLDHHRFRSVLVENGRCVGVRVIDLYSAAEYDFPGPVIIASGGLNGLFPGLFTGSNSNAADVSAMLFAQGVEMANLEFVQYHPTTAAIPGKRMLISESARGEGGRLFVFRDGKRYYFMEDKYPEMGNLMPRDIVSKEIALHGGKAFLDMTCIEKQKWETSLSDLREECIRLIGVDPATDPVEISPGIHYFMGGILVNEKHETNIPGLFTAGECSCAYHGANRLGGNSTLGAIFGGKTAAKSALKLIEDENFGEPVELPPNFAALEWLNPPPELENIMGGAMGIFRNKAGLEEGISKLEELKTKGEYENNLILLAKAALVCALKREESRGAHNRSDFPERKEALRKTSVVRLEDKKIIHEFQPIQGGK